MDSLDLLDLKIGKKGDKWYRDVESHYLPSNTVLFGEQQEEYAKLYRFFNNDLSDFEDDINRLCNNLVDFGAAKENLLNYNKIRNKFEILSGDLLTRPNPHRLLLLSAKAIKNKNERFIQGLQASVEKDLQISMMKAIETLQGMDTKQLEQFIQEERQSLTPKDMKHKNYLSDLEIYKGKMLQYTILNQDVKSKKLGTFKDLFITDGLYLYNGWKNGLPYIKVCNPLFTVGHKGEDVELFQHGSYVYNFSNISVTQALDSYINKLTHKDLGEILSYSKRYGSRPLTKDHLNKIMFNHAQYRHTENMINNTSFSKKQNTGLFENDSTHGNNRNELLTSLHMEFKAYKKIMRYSVVDEYGDKMNTIIRDDSKIIPQNANKVKFTNRWLEEDSKYVWVEDGAKHEAEILYIPRRYEFTRLGEHTMVDKREVPFQPTDPDRPFSTFELSYKGGKFNNRNAKSTSLMQNGLPYMFQIIAAKALQNREMASYRGFEVHQDVDQIPEDIGENNAGLSDSDIAIRAEIIAKKTKTRFYSSGRTSNGLVPSNRGAGIQAVQLGNSGEFISLQNFIQLVDQELGLSIGVPGQREGQTVNNSNVSDNERVVQQTTLQTQMYYYFHDKIWASALNEQLINEDTRWRRHFEKNPDSKDHLLEHILPDGTRELIKILPEYLDSAKIGLFLTDMTGDKMYKDLMLNKIAQNTLDPEAADILSGVLKAITSNGSTEEINRMIQVESKKLQERQIAKEKRESEIIAENKKAQMDLLKYQSELKKEVDLNKAKEDRITKLGTADLEFSKYVMQEDVNNNQVPDSVEVAKISAETTLAKTKLDNASKEKIAKTKQSKI